ncbi:phage major capsid protein [Clostridium sp. YIM B02500]|uniref:phage major capsid protein n=1 Tax=Clostridium sp. YIM B02500 TaxID=2910681 RepID=UPI001EEEE1B8|nr:phage major capsid protein [Clostridium sp. YIM B02500]
MFEKRMQEIKTKKEEIRGRLETAKDEELDTIQEELRSLDDEQKSIEKRMSIAKGINNGTIDANHIDTPEERERDKQKDFRNLTQDEIIASPEYRSAFLKNLQGKDLNETERRALTTASNSAGAAVPTTTLNLIIQKLQQTSALFNQINVTYIPGNLSLAVANAKNAASWKTEGSDGTPQDDTVIKVNLAGFELIKLVEISAASDAMTIDAFETYISGEIGRQLSIAIENAIINGAGNGEPTGILKGITWDATNSTTWASSANVGYDNLMDGMALLPTMYHQNACFCMNRKMLFGGIRKIKDDLKNPIFTYNPQDRAAMTILGYPIILDDYVPDDTILFCDHSYYYMNFSKTPEISSDRSAGFKSGKIVYRGLAVADGKPALSEAFVKISKATTA